MFSTIRHKDGTVTVQNDTLIARAWEEGNEVLGPSSPEELAEANIRIERDETGEITSWDFIDPSVGWYGRPWRGRTGRNR